MPRPWRIPAVFAILAAIGASSAEAASFGSSLRQAPNTGWGCESVPTYDVFTNGPTLRPSGFATCTLRNGGQIGSTRNVSMAPADGRITRIKVRSGPNPAPLRLTVLDASTRANSPDAGGGGDYSCCTARFLGRTFRPRPNAVTTRRVNVAVTVDRDRRRGQTISYFDEIALSAMGPGTLPLHDDGSGGQLRTGAWMTVFSYPFMRRGDTRVDGVPADGLELLFRWRFRRAR